MTAREPAWRVFVAELQASTSVERGTGEKSPSYLISPYGARINRVLMAGRLEAPATSVGGPGFLGTTFTDPTGSIGVSSGSFLPRGHQQLSRLQEPTAVLLVGKVGRRPGRSGETDAVVRVEGIRPLDENELRAVQAEILLQSTERVRLTAAGRKTTPERPSAPPSEGRPRWRSHVPHSLATYPASDLPGQLRRLGGVLDVLEGRRPPAPPDPVPSPGPARSTVTIVRTSRREEAAPEAAPSAAARALESTFLDVVDQLGEESIDGYAELRGVIERCARVGINERTVEEILNRLEESGAIEEPIVGRLRRA